MLNQTIDLVRAEVRLLAAELSARALGATRVVVRVALVLLLALFSVMYLTFACFVALQSVMPAFAAALVTGSVLLLLAVLAARPLAGAAPATATSARRDLSGPVMRDELVPQL
jgi:hypothetical protein